VRTDPEVLRPVSPGSLERQAEVVVIGAGPAGLAAAQAAAEEGARVCVVDAAPQPGGQVWRAHGAVVVPPVRERLARLQALGVEILSGTRVAWPLGERRLLLDRGDRASVLHWDRLVLATGARERLLPFPGWTRPGVFGAGGLQALVKGGWPIAGRRVLVAGTGPLLLASAATLQAAGAVVVEIAEEAPLSSVARFGLRLLGHGRALATALGLQARLLRVPYRPGWQVVTAQPDAASADAQGPALRVTLAHADGRTREVACDALAAGWGLVPQVELAEAVGCRLVDVRGARAVAVDAGQRTSVEGVFAAGEPTGIAGRDAASASGAIAGREAGRRSAGRGVSDAREHRTLRGAHRFADLVAATFPPPDDLAVRLHDDTIVCRCEDVRWSDVRACDDRRSAKLATRCGMGHCQGRLCHEALRALGLPPAAGSPIDSPAPGRPVRAPISPMPIAHLLAVPHDTSASPFALHPHQDPA
jgi:NADPH-dependent 2,4-dienoyl-CoA reductase/sulfur reductase-like enzyme